MSTAIHTAGTVRRMDRRFSVDLTEEIVARFARFPMVSFQRG